MTFAKDTYQRKGNKVSTTSMNQPRTYNRAMLLLSVASTVVWSGVAMFLLKWTKFWVAGNLHPGEGTSWLTLYGIFIAAVIATLCGLFLAVLAFLGKSSVRWQMVSLFAALLFLWGIAGH